MLLTGLLSQLAQGSFPILHKTTGLEVAPSVVGQVLVHQLLIKGFTGLPVGQSDRGVSQLRYLFLDESSLC